MIGSDKAQFYHVLGSMVNQQRVAMSMTVAQLCKLSGEQNKTIRSIEAGRPCSMHHLQWITGVLEIRINEVLNHMENSNVEAIKKESSQESGQESSKEESKKDDFLSSLI